jgi:hypothetical protein
MENKVNRILQDKINLLSKPELDALAQSYIGKYASILFDSLFTVSKVVGYEPVTSWFPNGLDEDDKDRDRKKGDKTILFILENGQMWELVDFASIGDTLSVKDASGGGYSNLEITELSDTMIAFSDGTKFFLNETRKENIIPMLIDIGWLSKNSLPQMPKQQASIPAFRGNSSKILNYLQIPQELSDNFPEDIKEFVAIIEGSQEIYSESVDSKQKEKLAELIVGWMRQLMEFLQTQKLGIYGNMNVKLEQQTLPSQDKPNVQPQLPATAQTTPPQPPQRKTRTPKPKPAPPVPPTPPEPPMPEQEEHQPPFTKEELEDAIASAEIMSEIGDEDGIKDLQDLRSLYNRYYL